MGLVAEFQSRGKYIFDPIVASEVAMVCIVVNYRI